MLAGSCTHRPLRWSAICCTVTDSMNRSSGMAPKTGTPLSVTVQQIADHLSGLLEQANPHNRQKIQRFEELMLEHMNMGALTDALS